MNWVWSEQNQNTFLALTYTMEQDISYKIRKLDKKCPNFYETRGLITMFTEAQPKSSESPQSHIVFLKNQL
jgi:hypothetical protein